MTTKKSKSTSRTKSGTLYKKDVAKAVKSISTTKSKETSTRQKMVVGRDAQTGKFVTPLETTFQKTKNSTASSKLRTKAGTLKRTIVKDAVVSVTQSRSTQKKKK